jgi:DNA-nicking Smr family endonuclease
MPHDDDKIWAAYTKGVKRVRKSTPKSTASFRKTFSSDGATGRKKTYAESHLIFLPERKQNGIPDQFSFVSQSESKRKLSGMTPFIKATEFSHTTQRRMRRGEILIDARIDLHGMTQVEAHAALEEFIAAQVKTGHRNLLIITGKGKANQGILKTNLVGWLENLPDAARIIGIHQAAIRHGGEGAFYVILKRLRE